MFVYSIFAQKSPNASSSRLLLSALICWAELSEKFVDGQCYLRLPFGWKACFPTSNNGPKRRALKIRLIIYYVLFLCQLVTYPIFRMHFVVKQALQPKASVDTKKLGKLTFLEQDYS